MLLAYLASLIFTLSVHFARISFASALITSVISHRGVTVFIASKRRLQDRKKSNRREARLDRVQNSFVLILNMKNLGLWCLGLAYATTGAWALPYTPYTPPHFGSGGTPNAPEQGATLKLKRAIVESDVHPLIARAQAVNRAYKKFSKRFISRYH